VIPVRVFLGKGVAQRDIDGILAGVEPLFKSIDEAEKQHFLGSESKQFQQFSHGWDSWKITAIVEFSGKAQSRREWLLERTVQVQIREESEDGDIEETKKVLSAQYNGLRAIARTDLFITR
jgi:hypothetical protein